jgi:hypothetical protein
MSWEKLGGEGGVISIIFIKEMLLMVQVAVGEDDRIKNARKKMH